jgi:ubiquinone/menaquinone biosynthesis C-methylase UbiE
LDARTGVHLADLERYRFCYQYTRDRVVLDIACGSGYGTHLLATRGGARLVIAADRSNDALGATRRLQTRGVHLIRTSTEALPLADASVDVVTSIETIEHLDHPDAYLRELRRVLRPSGVAIISTPRNESETRHRPANPFHVREYSASEFQATLASTFQRIEMYSQVMHFRDEVFGDPLRQPRWMDLLRKGLRGVIPTRARQALRKMLRLEGLVPHRSDIAPGMAAGADVQIAVCS